MLSVACVDGDVFSSTTTSPTVVGITLGLSITCVSSFDCVAEIEMATISTRHTAHGTR